MKTRIGNLALASIAFAVLAFAGVNPAFAQGTAIGYQGRLNEGGLPATGLYDFTFVVFEAGAGGAALAPTVVLDAVPVTNGLFNVALNFGPGIFTGAARWLEITVRANGVGVPKILTPRTPLLPTPYTIFAGSAGSVASGTVTANQLNTGGLAPTPGQFLSYNGGNLFWSDPGVAAGDIFLRNGTSAYYNAGNVGIGTTTPSAYGHGGTARILEVNNSGATLHSQAHLMLYSGVSSLADSAMGTVTWAQPGGMAAYIGAQTRSTTPNAPSAMLSFGTRKIGDGAASPKMVITEDGNVGIGTTSPGFKLDVLSATSTAIVGRSTVSSGVGVYGESSQFNGVRGVANNVNHGAVVGVHNTAGIGVLGQSTGIGVFGNSLGAGAGVYGESAQFNGVRGLAHNANHGGVVGIHDGGGIAVYGTGATGVQGDGTSAGGYGGSFRNMAGGIALNVQGTARVGVLQITGGADVAEPFKMSHEHIAKGSVVVIDEDHPGQLKLSDQSYDPRVAGIVSGANGVNPGISLQQEGVLEGGQNVSLSGRVYVQADAASGSIKPGDLLTTSDTPGHAMKVSDSTRSQGAILGKAMSALKEGKGMVLVLVTLQ